MYNSFLNKVLVKTTFVVSLVSMQDPPVKTVRKFLHLLEHSDADFEEELGINF